MQDCLVRCGTNELSDDSEVPSALAAYQSYYGLSPAYMFIFAVFPATHLGVAVYCLFWWRRALVFAPADAVIAALYALEGVLCLLLIGSSVLPARSAVLRKMQAQVALQGQSSRLLGWLRGLVPCIRVVAPVSCVDVVWWWLRIAWYSGVPLSTEKFAAPLWFTVMGKLATLTFYPCGCVLAAIMLMTPWSASCAATSHLIDECESGEVVDWKRYFVKVHDLDRMLEDLWSASHAGLPWIFMVSSLCGLTALGAQMLLSPKTEFAMAWPFFFSGIFGNAGLLYALSMITTMCASTKVSAHSIPAAARRFLAHPTVQGKSRVEAMSEEELLAHHRCVSYLSASRMGVQLCGMLVTQRWVATMTIQLAVVAPTLYKVLVHLDGAHRESLAAVCNCTRPA